MSFAQGIRPLFRDCDGAWPKMNVAKFKQCTEEGKAPYGND